MRTRINSIPTRLLVLLPLALVTNQLAAGQTDASPSNTSAPPNDPLFEKQEGLFRKLNVFEAWRVTKGDSNVLIGIIYNGSGMRAPEHLPWASRGANMFAGFEARQTH